MRKSHSARFIRFCLVLSSGLIAFPATADAQAEGPPPNILLITADNIGYGDLGCYGNDDIQTPHIDRLASQGAKLTDFYSASPTCTVSRACLLTGRYPQTHGLNVQLPGIEGNYGVGLDPSEIILPRLLSPLGYKTACFGKWNIGFAPGSRPTERGFDEFFGHASGNINYYTHVYQLKPDMHRGIEPVQVEGYSTDLFADEAIDFIERNRRQPWFVYLPFNAPHFPSARNNQPEEPLVWQAPDEAFAAYGWSPEEQDEKRRYFAVMTALDSAVGRVLESLDRLQLAENTVVVFYSDNGAFMLPGRGLEVATNAPLRDGGVTLYEGGIRVACLVRWPRRIEPGSTCSEPLISLDWFPFAVRLAGGEIPDDLLIDGRDPTAVLTEGAASPHEALFFAFRKYRAMRQGRYKIISSAPEMPFELYDLESDVGESRNLAEHHPDRLDRMRRTFENWLKEAVTGDVP